MASYNYIGDAEGVARLSVKGYAGDPEGVARRLIRGYIGDAKGVAQMIYSVGVRWLKYAAKMVDEGHMVEVDPITVGSKYVEYLDTDVVTTYAGYELYDNGVDDYGIEMQDPYDTPAYSLDGCCYVHESFSGYSCVAQFVFDHSYQPDDGMSVYVYELRPVVQIAWASNEVPRPTGETVGPVFAEEGLQPEPGEIQSYDEEGLYGPEGVCNWYYIKTSDGLFYYERVKPPVDDGATSAILGRGKLGLMIINSGPKGGA